jgi:Fe-Mn family superoxide dismutase
MEILNSEEAIMKAQMNKFWCLIILGATALGFAMDAPASSQIVVPPLPFSKDALAPYISEDTLNYHYDKHHKGYAGKLNGLIEEKNLSGLSLEDIIKKSHDNPNLKGVFNAAAQVWNHSFYWSSMKPGGGGKPTGAIKGKIEAGFGTYEVFQQQFIEAGVNQFGSGWVWLVLDSDQSLKIVATGNADLPLVHGQKALLTCDLWEHAYYLDYQNRRKDYVSVFLDHLVNWDFANQNLLSGEN